MDEDVFNIELRKFLKQVGVTTQREIEKAARTTTLASGATLQATATITIAELNLHHVVTAEIKTG